MTVTLDKEDLLRLVKGTGGPGAYEHPFGKYGDLYGFPNERWGWNDRALDNLMETQLWDLYNELKEFKKKQ